MPINIKELFVSDLDPNSQTWWSSQKIGKINHNFDLLKYGTIGPKGDKGDDGEPGGPGTIGEKGYTGALGPQGFAGTNAIGLWSHVDNGAQRTLFPTSFDELDINIKIGRLVATRNSDIKVDGVIDIKDSEVTTTIAGSDYDTTIQLVNDIGYVDINTKLNVTLSATTKNLNITPVHETSGETAINLITPGSIKFNDLVEISGSNINISNNFNSSTPSGDFTINTDNLYLKLDANINPGSFLMAANTQGKVVWANKADVFNSAYPIGSIVKIPLSFFEDNFEVEYEITPEEQGTGLVKFKWGRGKIGTSYEGWYLCHGKTWSNDSVSYATPNLNKFNFVIEGNGVGQPYSITEQDYYTPLIAGYDVTMLVSGTDVVISNLREDEVFSTQLTSGTGAYDVSQMIHIVYLEENDLTWDSTIEIERGNFINLGLNTIDSGEACAATQIEFELFPALGKDYPLFVINFWDNVNSDFSDKILYSVDSNRVRLDLAPAGWYSTGTVARYWDPELGTNGEFDLVNIIECSESSDIYYDNCLVNLNDISTATPGTYTLDGGSVTDLSIATTIESGGVSATAGWYYQTNEVDVFIKRYWTGSQFEGVTITKPYVYRIKNASKDFYYYNFGTGCEGCCLAAVFDSSVYQIPTYLATNTIITNTSAVQLADITGQVIYTFYDWDVYSEIISSEDENICGRGLSLITDIGFIPRFIYEDITDPNLEYIQIGLNGRLFGTVASCDPCNCNAIE